MSVVRLFPSCAPLRTQKNLAEEVSNPSSKARHSMSTRRSLPLVSDQCVLHFVMQALVVSHTCARYQSCHFMGDFSIAVLPNITDHGYRSANSSSSRSTTALVSAHVALRRTLSIRSDTSRIPHPANSHRRTCEELAFGASSIDSVFAVLHRSIQ